MTLFQQQMLIRIHTPVSLVTTGHHLNQFFVKGHPRPLRREFPPSPLFWIAHTNAHGKVCANMHSLSQTLTFTPPAYENLDQNDVDGGCEWMSVCVGGGCKRVG